MGSRLSTFATCWFGVLIAEGVEGAITGSSNVRVTHMLYADDLCLTVNRPDQLQTRANQSSGRVCQEERVNHQYC